MKSKESFWEKRDSFEKSCLITLVIVLIITVPMLIYKYFFDNEFNPETDVCEETICEFNNMDISNIQLELEQIGLTKSEIKVYFALLKMGASTTGPIINESRTANSKVYEVLEKLNELPSVETVIKEEFGFIVENNSGIDPRREIFKLAVEKDWTILNMEKSRQSLEEIFRKLSNQRPLPMSFLKFRCQS